MEHGERQHCSAIKLDGLRCERPLYDARHCICHSEREDKDVKLFQRELDKTFSDEEAEFYDLSYFVFPEEGYRLPGEYKKDAYFDHAHFGGHIYLEEARFVGVAHFFRTKFSGAAHFYGAEFLRYARFYMAEFSGAAEFRQVQFSQETDFREAKFSGKADFMGARFLQDVYFVDARFSGEAEFFGAKFSGSAYFGRAKFSRKAGFRWAQYWSNARFVSTLFTRCVDFSNCTWGKDSHVVFDAEDLKDNKMFLQGASFLSLILLNPKQLIFRKVSLEECAFLETDTSKAQFIDVDWPMKGRWFKRKAVYDQISPDVKWLKWNESENKQETKEPPKYQCNLIAQLYRRLQANYVSNYRFPEAGDFYIGEQEMMRKAKGKYRQYFCTNLLYKIISYYGESFTLPLLWLLLTLFVFPGLLLYGGINLDYDSQITGLVETVNYDWTWSPKDLLLLKSDYWNTLAVNLSFVTFHRSEITTYLPQILQRAMVNLQILLVIALAAFFLLALRRKFKRKSF